MIGIISVVSLFGASSLISARERYILNSAVEETVSNIREAQNKSISIAEGKSGWGFRFNEAGTAIEIFNFQIEPGLTVKMSAFETISLASGTTVSQDIPGERVNIIFVAPFGTSYLTSGSCDEYWTESNKPSLELMPISPCIVHNEVIFTIGFQEHSAMIKVNARGDIEVN